MLKYKKGNFVNYAIQEFFFLNENEFKMPDGSIKTLDNNKIIVRSATVQLPYGKSIKIAETNGKVTKDVSFRINRD